MTLFFALFLLAGLIGRSFHELINYVEHYGLVRVENSPIMPHHSWDCYRTLSKFCITICRATRTIICSPTKRSGS